jgi:uncharacterized protein YndB with AHSA1/START domain
MTGNLADRIRQRTFIAAAPTEVYDTFTSAEKWDAFFTTGMQLDPKPGGICSFAWKDWGPDKYTLAVPGKVLEADRPRLFAFQWGGEGKGTVVRIELEGTDTGTVLTLTESGYRDDADSRAMMLECASGWGEAITLLKFFIEHGITYSDAARPGRA